MSGTKEKEMKKKVRVDKKKAESRKQKEERNDKKKNLTSITHLEYLQRRGVVARKEA
jgi:hypothetical protein